MDAGDIRYVSLNAVDGAEGQQRHTSAGKPIIPSILIDGSAYAIQHPSQIASILGLEVEGLATTSAMAWDIAEVTSRWVEVIRDAPFERLVEPTQSRGRSIRNLTVNTFRPIGYIERAWREHRFDWYTGEADLQQEAFLLDTGQLVAFAQDVLMAYHRFLLDAGDDLDAADPELLSNRGDMTFSLLVTTQRFHCAFHYRQVLDHLTQAGVTQHGDPLPEGLEADIGLPADVY